MYEGQSPFILGPCELSRAWLQNSQGQLQTRPGGLGCHWKKTWGGR